MGIKLRKTLNPLEASIEDGFLKVYFFDEVIKEVELPIPKGITINKQCNFFSSPLNHLVGYLYNEKYVVIIRVNGNIDILTNNFVLLKRVKVNIKDILDESISIRFCGSLFVFSSVAPAYIATLQDGKSFIFSEKASATILLDMEDKTSKSIYDWAMKHGDDVGTLHIKDNSSGGTALWVNFGTNDHVRMYKYKILSSSGVIGGILR